MKIFDMHIHARGETPDPQGLLEKMDKAGVYGGCVFSNRPLEFAPEIGMPFEKRLELVFEYSKGNEGRIFPVLWIHPYEENIIEKVHIAVERGIMAFKIICGDFYIYEEPCLNLLREIAKLNKPVFFHSGILWDSKVSSNYNRPLNWEALLEIEGLRFSMGHCSWPWIDECIALYGKFMNAGTVRSGSAEMFFDITPGTPEIYRRELLTKLYTLGYDVGDNVMFGTDSTAHIYRTEWPAQWLRTDGEILDLLGISQENREKLYRNNLMRFLGKSEQTASPLNPTPDDSNKWSGQNKDVPAVIEAWYQALQFPRIYDWDFKDALATVPVSDAITTASPAYETEDGRRNLLQVLYLCEKTKELYQARGIPREILMDTLSDIVTWTNTWSGIRDGLYLGELSWLKRHLEGKLFRLGRLQFCMGHAEQDIPQANVKKGDSVIEIHIPEGDAMTAEACDASIARAREFFGTYFPEFDYKCFTCHSWLLDPTLAEILKPESNILTFQSRFTVTESDADDSIVRYVFAWNATRYNLKKFACETSLAQRVKARIQSGGGFYVSLGFFK